MGKTETEIISLLVYTQVDAIIGAGLGHSQELSTPHESAKEQLGSQPVGSPQTLVGSWIRSGLTRTETGTHTGC